MGVRSESGVDMAGSTKAKGGPARRRSRAMMDCTRVQSRRRLLTEFFTAVSLAAAAQQPR